MLVNQMEDDLSIDDPDTSAMVQVEQLRLLVRRRADLPLNLLLASVVSATVWRFYPAWVLLFWLAVFGIVILARYRLRDRFQRVAPDAGTIRIWGGLFAFAAGSTGCLWGIGGSLILVTTDFTHQVFVVFILGGVMAGGIVGNATYLPAMLAFMLPTIVPAIVALIISPAILQIEMGLMLAVFGAVLANTGRNINQSIIANLRLRIGQGFLLTRQRISETAMADAQKIAHTGSWTFDIRSSSSTWSAEIFSILGADPVTAKPSYAAILARVHPDDRPVFETSHAASIRAQVDRGMDYRILMDDGVVRWVHQVVRTTCDANGCALRLDGTMQDITARKQSETTTALLAAIVDSSFDAIVGESVAGTITSWNRGAEHLFGYRADEIIGQNVRMIIPEDRREEIDRNLATLARGANIAPFDTERLRKGGKRIAVSIAVSPVRDAAGNLTGGSFISRDITQRNQTASALAYRDRLQHAVTMATAILIKTQSLEEGMPKALRILGEAMQVDRVVVLEDDPNQNPPMALRHRWEAADIGVHIDEATFAAYPIDPVALATWVTPLRAGEPVVAQLATAEGAIRALLEYLQNKSMILMPISVGKKVWGTLGLDACTRAREWTASEINILTILADIAGSLILRNETQRLLKASQERFQILTATAQDAIITIDQTSRIGSWNRSAERILGYSAAEAVGRHVHELLTPTRFRETADEAMKNFSSTGEGKALGRTTELAAIRKDGVEIAIELSLAAARVGGAWQAIAILRDISDRKLAESRLQYANILLSTEMEASPDGILVVDPNRAIRSFNKRFADMWRIPQAHLADGDDNIVLEKVVALVKDPQGFAQRVKHLYDHPAEGSHDLIQTTDDRSIDRYTSALLGPAGEYLGRAWFFRDVTEQKQAAAHAIRLARFDGLTGLANRSALVEALEDRVSRAKSGGKGFALIYLDLDHFKDVNDTLGHSVGDALLQAVAERLRLNMREADIIARFSGDEFALLLTDLGEPAEAVFMVERLIQLIAQPFSIKGNVIYTGISIGIDLYGPGSPDGETLLSHAEVALYRAKAEGRGGYRFFTEVMDKEVRLRVVLGTELRDAIDSGQLFLLYQPQVAVESGLVTGVEALVRWRHPQRGVISPEVFIPIAEAIGMISKLGHWVLWTACKQAKAWFDAGTRPIRMSVNVSARQFRPPDALEADIIAALAQTGLPPPLLELELTESVLMDASRDHAGLLQRLRKIGLTIAIDDFGTGYSSLEYLRRFPSNRIKIAQTFVKNLETTAGDAAIVKATIGLARELGIMVIAEGVENLAQYDLLKHWGCGEIQGYYFARPLPADEIVQLMKTGGIIQPKAV